MAQVTGYGYELDKAQAGQKYDIRPDWVASFAAEAEIAPGEPVMRGTDPEKQVLVSDGSGFVGIALFTHTLVQSFPADGNAVYAAEDAVSVLTKGAAWVESAVDDVVAGEAAYVTATGTYTNVSTENLEIGQFITGGDTGDLVVVELA